MTEFVIIIGIVVIAVSLVTIVVYVAARLVTATRQEHAMKKRAEASERLSQQIIANITSGLLVVGEDRVVRTLNPAGRRMLGIAGRPEGHSMTEVLGTATPLVAVVEECLQSSRAVIRRTLQTGLPGGGTAHLGVTVSPIRDGISQQGAICLFSDLSDVVELEEQLRFKDSLARVGELTAGIAHEFRNGLATIHGYSRLVDLEKLPADYKPFLQGIRDETEALRQVVTNFLNFAKPAELTLSAVPLRAVADRAADEVRSEAIARGGHVEVAGEFGTAQGDEVLLRQAFSNLVRNALEACRDAAVAPRIHIDGTIDRAQATQQMIVSDNGPGVDASVTARMFRPFFTTKARGTGLGLALVQKIVVTHNGRVTVATGDEGGARITVTLPLERV
jgi:signal transduction histidine kinase